MSRAETLAGLTEAIARHTAEFYDWWDECDSDYYTCLCGEVRWHVNTSADYHRAHAAHVADVALAWLEGHGWAEGDVTEWGVRYKRDVVPMPDEETARKELRELDYARIMTLVRRRVTAWVPVETGEDA